MFVFTCRRFAFLWLASVLISLCPFNNAQGWIFGKKGEGEDKKNNPPDVVMPPAAGGQSIAAGTAEAGQSGSRILARPHMRFADPEEEKQLLTFINARRRAQEDYAVVTRLIEEKNLEIKTFSQQMKEMFGVDPDLNYQFDADSGTIFQLVAKPDLADEQKKQTSISAEQLKEFYDFKEHLKLGSEEEKTRFMRLAAGKQLANEQIRMLSLLQNEKEIENSTLHEEMANRYAISMDREYRYDNDSKTLFELVVVPADYVEPTASTTDPIKAK